MRRALASIVILTLLSAEAAAMENWIAAAKILRNGGTSGSGILSQIGPHNYCGPSDRSELEDGRDCCRSVSARANSEAR